jgi:serine/threonine protein kinase HipA of HipAB toxin-antitoxin module
MPVEHDDGVRGEDGKHGKSLGSSDAHGEKALPIATDDGAAGAELLQDSDRNPNDFNRGLRSNTWGLRGGSVRDKGNRVELVITRAGYGGNV